ncbi:MAG: APC family permease [Candidatus Micrarchaeia archaeon]|jgi:APA family basic amino acid/polyamine antiporter
MQQTLERKLTLTDATFFEVGGIIGAGVFVLIGLATGMSGPAIVLAVALAGFVSFVTALSYAEISSAIPAEGGEYEYAYRLVSPAAGNAVGLGWLAADITSSAVVSIGFASYFTAVFPQVPTKIAACGAVALVTTLNLLGVKLSARANNVISTVKIAVLAFFIVFALAHFNPSNFSPLAPKGVAGITSAAALFFFAFSGFGKITRLSEEVRDAERTLPKSIIAALALCTLLYIMTAVALVGAVGWASASSTNSPLASALAQLGAPGPALVVTAGALAATFSVLLTNNAGISRIIFAFGRRHKKAASLSELHSWFKTPWKAVLLAGAATTAIVSFVEMQGIATIASFLFLVYYAAINSIAIAARGRENWKPRFRTPFFPLFPVLGIISCALLLAGLVLSTQ